MRLCITLSSLTTLCTTSRRRNTHFTYKSRGLSRAKPEPSLVDGFGWAWGLRKPKPGLSGQAGPEHHYSTVSYINEHTFDTLVSVLTLCSIPSPENTLTDIVSRVLKPGGQLFFYEHVLS